MVSTARDEATADSDIDLLISFDRPATLKTFFGVQFYVEDLLERRVDLITEKFLPDDRVPIIWTRPYMSRPNQAQRSWRSLVRDMISFSESALSYAEGLGKDELLTAQPNYDAILWNITLVGEAASSVPIAVTGAHSEIPWQEIVGTRHHLVHGYFRINQDIVWDIVDTHLPTLLPQLRTLLEAVEEPS